MQLPHCRATRALAFTLTLLTAAFQSSSFAQHPATQPDAAHILHKMQKLDVLGSVLYIAAHPDDENTRLIAWLSNGKKVRTGYLSLTRGDGGQNLIGPELGDALGIIRTQELMEARRIDGGEQFFTRAVDFGYSKNAEESFEKWGKEEILSDVVRVIRKFRPDIIITRFPPDRTAGHGHHEASAILAREAFALAGDPNAFPEQLEQGLEVWQPRRLFFNGSTWWKKDLAEFAQRSSDWYTVDVGGYDPLLGMSYTEIAGQSRSMHKSQGFGAAQTRGEQLEYLHFELGDKPKTKDIFEGIDMTWGRLKDGAATGEAIRRSIDEFNMRAVEKSVPALCQVAANIDRSVPSAWKDLKRKQVDALLLDVTGTAVDALAKVPHVATGDSLHVELDVLTRSSAQVSYRSEVQQTMALTPNNVLERSIVLLAPLQPDQPFWLELPHGNLHRLSDPRLIGDPVQPPALEVPYTLLFGDGTVVKGTVPVMYRHVDRVKGEQVQVCHVVPPVSVYAKPPILMVHEPSGTVQIDVEALTDLPRANLKCELVADWEIKPVSQQLGALSNGEHAQGQIEMIRNANVGFSQPEMRLDVGHAGPTMLTHRTIAYDHIMPQSWYTGAGFRVVPLDVKVNAKLIGYIKGAGDDVPQAIEQLGVEVEMIDATRATFADLSKFDAIVVGIRAYNTDPGMERLNPLLMQFAKDGGTVVVQYTTLTNDMVLPDSLIGPYPFKLTRGRVTVEEAPPTFLAPKDPLLNTPNVITAADFKDWVQERGLYFVGDRDPRYTALIAWNDPGEAPLDGALITCDIGKGRYVYTGISFFRELPAGVPGAFRLFANLISKRSVPGGR